MKEMTVIGQVNKILAEHVDGIFKRDAAAARLLSAALSTAGFRVVMPKRVIGDGFQYPDITTVLNRMMAFDRRSAGKKIDPCVFPVVEHILRKGGRIRSK